MQASDDPKSTGPEAGLTDPRPTHHGPEILGSGPDAPSGTDPGDVPADDPAGPEDVDDGAAEARGLADPRSEVTDPSEP